MSLLTCVPLKLIRSFLLFEATRQTLFPLGDRFVRSVSCQPAGSHSTKRSEHQVAEQPEESGETLR
jgi:hypothetical protein